MYSTSQMESYRRNTLPEHCFTLKSNGAGRHIKRTRSTSEAFVPMMKRLVLSFSQDKDQSSTAMTAAL